MATAPGTAATGPTAGVDVLIAEDSRMQAKILQKRLTEAGHTVRWAENGQLALEMARERRPEIIISDIEMPVATGYEFCKAVKTDPALRTVPFILLSTLSDPIDIIRGLDAGADNYVTKPYEPDYLLGRMQALLATPLAESEEAAAATLEVSLAGQTFQVKAGRQQVLNLLVSTFENAVSKNQELVVANQELSVARDSLQKTNEELTSLNAEISRINAQMVRDLTAAAKVQRSLLPADDVSLPGLEIAWRYVPCHSLAGDFLNIFQLDEERVGLFVVDVSGHGVPSSLMAVTVGRFLTPKVSDSSILVRQGADGKVVVATPAEVATQLNHLFQADEFSGLYFTMLYGVLHVPSGRLDYAAGGHPALVRIPAAGGAPEFHGADGFPIAFVPEVEYGQQTLQLEPGDRIYLYSDGVPEAMDQDQEAYGDEKMAACLDAGRRGPLAGSVGSLLEAVEAWCQPKGPLDDVTILGVEWKP
ncbi:MAG: SpoIIE family protein phosphatase [Planctomycetota bacterium]|nr:SpoIIE family protein phosphatase [Planctomycetota bacterium]MDA1200654.1 SpoIIE family protein phosphatase [Planctomycetota bacterium]